MRDDLATSLSQIPTHCRVNIGQTMPISLKLLLLFAMGCGVLIGGSAAAIDDPPGFSFTPFAAVTGSERANFAFWLERCEAIPADAQFLRLDTGGLVEYFRPHPDPEPQFTPQRYIVGPPGAAGCEEPVESLEECR